MGWGYRCTRDWKLIEKAIRLNDSIGDRNKVLSERTSKQQISERVEC